MKNLIRIIFKTNRILMCINIILLISIYGLFYGMYLEVILGFFQVITSVILLFFWNSYENKTKMRLKIYYSLVITYFLLLFFTDWSGKADEFYRIIIGIILIPMSLAIYFTFIIERIKRKIL